MHSTFPNYLLKSGWNALLPARQPHPHLRSAETADVVIVGAGYTGLACARRWQELAPQAHVVIIDAAEIGEGNPGRNSGFLLEIALAEDADPANIERMETCNQLTQQAMASIVRDVQAAGHKENLTRAGTFRAAASDSGLIALRNYQSFLDAADLPYQLLNQEDLRDQLGTEFYQEGLFSPHCYLAQPAAVIRAIEKQIPEGIRRYENTPALKLDRCNGAWLIRTPEGSLKCKHLVLANNAFAKNLGVAASRIASVFTYAALTPVLEESQLENLGSNTNWGLLPCHRLGSTLRRTADGRLLIRSLHGFETETKSQFIRQALKERMLSRFPQLKGIEFEHVWGGAIGFTLNSAPIWGEVEPELFVSIGCNGGGTVKGTLLGKLLAEHALGESVPDIAALFGTAAWMPPNPVRKLGFHISSKFQSWQARQEI